MREFHYEPMFQLGADETEYRPLDAEGLVDKTAVGGREVLVVDPEAEFVFELIALSHLIDIILNLDEALTKE